MWYKQLDKSWTIFLDRDGVINRRIFGGYVTKIEDFHFISGVLEGLPILAGKVGKIFIVTNQQGVAKNIMSLDDLHRVHQNMINEIIFSGGRIDYVFSAVNLKGEVNDQRKPNPFMAHKAKEMFASVEFDKSVMIGDTNSDIIFGNSLGMKTVLVKSEEIINETPDLLVDSLLDFVKKI